MRDLDQKHEEKKWRKDAQPSSTLKPLKVNKSQRKKIKNKKKEMAETKTKGNVIQLILDGLATSETCNSRAFAAQHQFVHEDVVGAIKSLAAEGYVTAPKVLTSKAYTVTEEGRGVMSIGSPEFRFYNSVSADSGAVEADLMPIFNNNKNQFMNGKKNAMAKRWIGFTKVGNLFTRKVQEEDVVDYVCAQLKHVHENGGAEHLFDDLTVWVGQKKKGDVYKTLKKRNMVSLKTTKELLIGMSFFFFFLSFSQ